jgi:hypothetical protein
LPEWDFFKEVLVVMEDETGALFGCPLELWSIRVGMTPPATAITTNTTTAIQGLIIP